MALFLPIFELILQSLFELAFLVHVLRPNIYAVVHIKHFIPAYYIEFATAHWVAFGGWQCNFVKSTGVCTKMNAGLVHFYVNIKQQKKIKKKRGLKVMTWSISVYISSGCVELWLVQRLLGYYFLRVSPRVSTIEWCACAYPQVHLCSCLCGWVCMHEKVYNDMNEERQIIA